MGTLQDLPMFPWEIVEGAVVYYRRLKIAASESVAAIGTVIPVDTALHVFSTVN